MEHRGSDSQPAGSGRNRVRGIDTARPMVGSDDELASIVAALTALAVPEDVSRRRGHQAEAWWRSITATPTYGALTIWVMARWPEAPVEAVDPMVRAIVGHVGAVTRGAWDIAHLIGVAQRAGRRTPHPARRLAGRRVTVVSLERLEVAAGEAVTPRASSVGPAAVDHLCRAFGPHAYLVTPPAAALIDRSADIAVDHLNALHARSASEAQSEGLVGLALFAAARPTKRVAKANRLTALFSDLEHHCALDLCRLLLGTDRHPTSALLWRTLVGCDPTATPAPVVANWRAEVVSLTPRAPGESERRRRRLRDRCRHGEDVRRAFEATRAPGHDEARTATQPPP